MKVELVVHVTGGLIETLSRSDIAFAIVPVVGDAIQWHADPEALVRDLLTLLTGAR